MTEKELKNEVLEDDFVSWDWVEQVEKHVPAISAAELMEMTIAPRGSDASVLQMSEHQASNLGAALGRNRLRLGEAL